MEDINLSEFNNRTAEMFLSALSIRDNTPKQIVETPNSNIAGTPLKEEIQFTSQSIYIDL